MTFIAIIEGVSGVERYLADGCETTELRSAKTFRSERAATEAAKAHIDAFPRVIRRAMRFTVQQKSTAKVAA